MRYAVDGISINEEGLLLVKKGNNWILPGGKPEVGEDDHSCLKREFGEELPNLVITSQPVYLGQVTGTTPHTGDELETALYLIEVAGEISPAAEISETVRTKDPLCMNLSDITRRVVAFLQRSGRL